jgi:phosphoglycerate kinase
MLESKTGDSARSSRPGCASNDSSGDGSRFGFRTLDDFDVRGKRVLLRLDINSPVDERTLKLEDGSKIRSSIPTLKELLDRGAKVVILAHQGRPGDYDFISLNEHASYLSRFSGKKVRYVDDIIGSRALKAIDGLGEGECIIMKNVRELPDEQLKKTAEEHSNSALVKTLAPRFDIYINDAFASSHRAHASLVGFTPVMPSAAGRLLEKEVRTLSQVFRNPERPSTYIFGGKKFADTLMPIEKLLTGERADNVLVAGLAGYAFLWALGRPIGSGTEVLARKDVTEEDIAAAKRLYEKHRARILLPRDAAVDENGKRKEYSLEHLPSDAKIMDIGQLTILDFTKVILGSKTVFLSGPPGVFEREEFCVGTRLVYEAIVSSGAYSVLGGGHSSAAANRLGMLEQFSYASTGGGALERFMLGKSMPVIEALSESATKH